ncbi:E3 ubiquitin-protein ligase At1g12760-like [Silene latifolia]|uniref:E3 ubiquitin-protein ligase At1g12760-like n=1 Tax=Silene latifolia TaxID=37657 RepID=UPI003D77E093
MSTTETNPVADTTAPLLSSTNSGLQRAILASCRPAPLAMVLELIWCAIIVTVAVVVLAVLSKGETTKVPLRVWIVGFVVLRVLRMVCVLLDYFHRKQLWEVTMLDPDNTVTRKTALGRVAKCSQTVNTVLNVIWWIVGLYWMFSGGKTLANDAPKLFWFTVIFLALDLFVLLIFAFMSCILCVAGYCFLQFIMPILSRVPDENGENEDLIARLTRNISRRFSVNQDSSDGTMNNQDDIDTPAKHDIAAENAV